MDTSSLDVVPSPEPSLERVSVGQELSSALTFDVEDLIQMLLCMRWFCDKVN